MTEVEVDRALKWFLFALQAFLRRPRRGGKKGRVGVAARFAALTAGDWGSLVEKWRVDMEYDEARGARRVGRRRGEGVEEQRVRQEGEKLRRQVLSLIMDGQVGRAMSRVTSFSVASARDRAVQEQLQSKYPPRHRELPGSVLKGQPVENLRGLREALVKLQRGVLPGGCLGEYLAVLGEQLEEVDKVHLEAAAAQQVLVLRLGGRPSSWSST